MAAANDCSQPEEEQAEVTICKILPPKILGKMRQRQWLELFTFKKHWQKTADSSSTGPRSVHEVFEEGSSSPEVAMVLTAAQLTVQPSAEWQLDARARLQLPVLEAVEFGISVTATQESRLEFGVSSEIFGTEMRMLVVSDGGQPVLRLAAGGITQENLYKLAKVASAKFLQVSENNLPTFVTQLQAKTAVDARIDFADRRLCLILGLENNTMKLSETVCLKFTEFVLDISPRRQFVGVRGSVTIARLSPVEFSASLQEAGNRVQLSLGAGLREPVSFATVALCCQRLLRDGFNDGARDPESTAEITKLAIKYTGSKYSGNSTSHDPHEIRFDGQVSELASGEYFSLRSIGLKGDLDFKLEAEKMSLIFGERSFARTDGETDGVELELKIRRSLGNPDFENLKVDDLDAILQESHQGSDKKELKLLVRELDIEARFEMQDRQCCKLGLKAVVEALQMLKQPPKCVRWRTAGDKKSENVGTLASVRAWGLGRLPQEEGRIVMMRYSIVGSRGHQHPYRLARDSYALEESFQQVKKKTDQNYLDFTLDNCHIVGVHREAFFDAEVAERLISAPNPFAKPARSYTAATVQEFCLAFEMFVEDHRGMLRKEGAIMSNVVNKTYL